MKKLFLTPVVMLLMFVFGCQETSITDPPLLEKTQYHNYKGELSKSGFLSPQGASIEINEKLYDPVRNADCELTGRVKYSINRVADDDQFKSGGKTHLEVHLDMFASLCQIEGPRTPWQISFSSSDLVLIDKANSENLLKKSYRVCERKDIFLTVTYSFDMKKVKIKAIEITERVKNVSDNADV